MGIPKPFKGTVPLIPTPKTIPPKAEKPRITNETIDFKLDELASVQQRYALVMIDGRIWIFDKYSLLERSENGLAKKLILSNRSDGKLLIKRYLKANHPMDDAEAIYEEFLLHPKTTSYTDVEFNPKGTPGKCLNLWIEPTISPKQGPWPLIKSFLLYVICDGDQKNYDYLIRYIAHALQRPWEKPGVMIILISGQGTGKGTLARILQMIWSATFIHVNNIDTVTGNFNAALERTFIVFMDEALFAGNRRASDRLKSQVTEETIHINEKYQPSRQAKSFHRFFAATNADHFKNTERDDRRDFTLRVSESHKGDHPFWQSLNHEIDSGGVEAMTYDLLKMDLSDFNVRNKPDTKELLEQKLQSLDHFGRWWFDCLDRGAVAAEDDGYPGHIPNTDDDTWPSFLSSAAAIKGIIDAAGGRMYQKPSAIDVVQQMKKLCPSAHNLQKQVHNKRQRGLALPSLQQARIEFEQYIGGKIKWPDVHDLDAETTSDQDPEEPEQDLF